LAVASCSSGAERDIDGLVVSTATISANPSPAVPLGAVLKSRTTRPVETDVSITDGKNSWPARFSYDDNPSKGLAVVGMRADRQHVISITVRDGKGNVSHLPELEYHTPPLPNDTAEFPKIDVLVKDLDKVEPGYTLFNPRRRLPDPRLINLKSHQ
jgi:hypothetical protein